MASLVGTQCYGTVQEATNTYYSVTPVSVYGSGAYTYSVRYVYTGVGPSNWSVCTVRYNQVGGAYFDAYCADAATPTMPTCNPSEGLADGIIVGWLVGSAIVVVTAIKFLQRAAS